MVHRGLPWCVLFISTLSAMVSHETSIETDRLQIRLITMHDADSLMAIFGDEEVMQYTERKPFSCEEVKGKIRNQIMSSYRERGWGRYAIIHKATQKLIGYGGFGERIVGHECPYKELGYAIARDEWKKGYATEAAAALVHYARTVLQFPHLIAVIDKRNLASLRVAQKVGFEPWKEGNDGGFPVYMYRMSFSAHA